MERIETIDRSRWPVFLVGCHRSGTTLARYLLDAHPNLACPPESKFLLAVQAFVAYPQTMGALQSLGCSREDLLDEFRRLATSIMGRYAASVNKRRWVDKTPNYYRILALIDEMFSQRCLYLFIVRHPLDTVDSLARSPCFTRPNPEDPDIAMVVKEYGVSNHGWAQYWVRVNRRLLAFSADVSDRCLVFRYEDLVETPECVMSQLLGFIGETLPLNLVETAFEMAHTAGYQDWKIKATTGLHKQSVAKWLSWSPDEIQDLWSVVGPTAEAFGYGYPQMDVGLEERAVPATS